MLIIDSHIHCGVQNVSQPYTGIQPLLQKAGITGACLFAPVEDIYYRHDPDFDDNDGWRSCRRRAHDYLLAVADQHPQVFAYYFVWNDFLVEDLDKGFSGIKWHHHAGEPVYRYDHPGCEAMIAAICSRRLPMVLEETFGETRTFLQRIAGRTPVIIPHLGMLNGGFARLLEAGIWEDENVFADTALAGRIEMKQFIDRYGPGRLLFGSDHPFGDPQQELRRVQSLGFTDSDLEKICGGNILGLFQRKPDP